MAVHATAQLAAVFDTKTMWYVTRATGVVSLLLLTASVVLGVTEAVRWMNDRWPRFVTVGIHRNISLLATTFICVHIATAIVDGYAPIGWVDAVVPFHAVYRPVWLGLGTVAFDLLVAIALTSLLRRRIGPRTWRLVHWGAYACWPIALVHGLGTGTDTKTTWLLVMTLGCMAAVVFAVWWRLTAVQRSLGDGRILAAASLSVLIPLLIAGWVVAGPLQAGWARQAGTPPSLLGGQAAAANTGSDLPTAAGPSSDPSSSSQGATNGFSSSFDASLRGTLADSGPDRRGNDTIAIDAQLSSGALGTVRVVLSGQAIDDGGISLTSGTVTLTSSSSESFTGAVTVLQGNVIDALVESSSSSSSSSMSLELDLVLQGSSVSGTAHGVAQ